MKSLTIILLSFLVWSCGHLNHGNFNKQKFTNLKSQHQDEENIASTEDEIIYAPYLNSDVQENSTDDLPTIESNENSEESITTTDKDNAFDNNISSNYVLLVEEEYTDSTEKILKHALALNYNFLVEINGQWFRIDSAIFIETTHSIEGSLVPVEDMTEYKNKRTIRLKTNGYINPVNGFISIHKGQILSLISSPDINPTRIPEEKKLVDDSSTTTIDSKEKSRSETARRRFDFLFTIGLVVFLLAVLAYLMAAFSLSWVMLVLSLLAATVCIIAAWVISLIMVSMSKRIKTPHRTTRFKVENTLAWLVASIGTAVVTGIGVLIIALFLGF